MSKDVDFKTFIIGEYLTNLPYRLYNLNPLFGKEIALERVEEKSGLVLGRGMSICSLSFEIEMGKLTSTLSSFGRNRHA